MAPRTVVMRDRDYDFGNVGTVGRRTGLTVEHRPRDDYGFEQPSGFFSSPRKSSPLKRVTVADSSAQNDSQNTPHRTVTHGRASRGTSVPPPRSASPKKSGIRGTARRSQIIDVKQTTATEGLDDEQDQRQEEPGTPKNMSKTITTNTLARSAPRRFSPQKTPLRSHVLGDDRAVRRSDSRSSPAESHSTPTRQKHPNSSEWRPTRGLEGTVAVDSLPDDEQIMGDEDEDEAVSVRATHDDGYDQPLPTTEIDDDDDVDQTHEFGTRPRSKSREQPKANSRRKRKSDAIEAEISTSPAAKRIRKRTKGNPDTNERNENPLTSAIAESEEPEITQTENVSRQPLASKDKNFKMPSRRERELNDIVEKVRARPGQQKSLYILRRETPADDHVARTRSGRVSVRPLAYWRNERCVYGGSPGGPTLEDGARFPLNSIREIIRTEEVEDPLPKKKRPFPKKPKKKTETDVHQLSDSETEEDDSERVDPNAEEWELENGTFRGLVSIWDPEQQAPVEQEEELELAHAPAAIQTKEVKGSTFRYAKLLSTKFFGSGIVDLPPGGVKRTKNSRKMHMSFFVAKGRVTVQVGPLNGPESRFSVGKGGFWQVPRGNQYSIENELEKPARVFFSQACEAAPQDIEE